MISKELLSIVLEREIREITYEDLYVPCSYNSIKGINFTFISDPHNLQVISQDELGRLCKEWLINGTNDIINTFNSSSVQGWVCQSSIYNKRIVKSTELEAVITLTKYVAKEKGLI